MNNIVKLTACKEVSHDIYAYFTNDVKKVKQALKLGINCTGVLGDRGYNIYYNDNAELCCEYIEDCVIKELKKVSSIQEAAKWIDKVMYD
ncbi:hypothetical protein [Bacteroides ovatus]|uniref:hypothetical protein n=1 Tax=Bacteroides ovatus TaxID=28116 RepID=UPI00189CB956|nr:hypothetical protein [Bacteroides ovatus]